MAKESKTYYEYVSDGYSVTIQHCEHIDADGEVCAEYLGVNYPSNFCSKHQILDPK